MPPNFSLLSALKDSLLNVCEGLPPERIREARRQAIQNLAPFPVSDDRQDWPLPEDLEVMQSDSQAGIHPDKYIHRGLACSMLHPDDPTTLQVTGPEFRRFVSTAGNLKTAIEKIKTTFQNLDRLLLDDDYLSDFEKDDLSALLLPVRVTWTHGLYIDGRHGR